MRSVLSGVLVRRTRLRHRIIHLSPAASAGETCRRTAQSAPSRRLSMDTSNRSRWREQLCYREKGHRTKPAPIALPVASDVSVPVLGAPPTVAPVSVPVLVPEPAPARVAAPVCHPRPPFCSRPRFRDRLVGSMPRALTPLQYRLPPTRLDQSSCSTPFASCSQPPSLLPLAAEAGAAADPENTLYLDLKDGRVVIELRPDLAPKHVARIKELTAQGLLQRAGVPPRDRRVHGADRRPSR